MFRVGWGAFVLRINLGTGASQNYLVRPDQFNGLANNFGNTLLDALAFDMAADRL